MVKEHMLPMVDLMLKCNYHLSVTIKSVTTGHTQNKVILISPLLSTGDIKM